MRLRAGDAEPWREVVGVVADNKYEFYSEIPKPQLFSPFLQTGGHIFRKFEMAKACRLRKMSEP